MINYKPIVIETELIDSIFNNLKGSIQKDDIKKVLHNNEKANNNSVKEIIPQTFFNAKLKGEINYKEDDFNIATKEEHFKIFYYFKLDNDRYILFCSENTIDGYYDGIKQTKYILDNNLNNNINNDELKRYQMEFVKDIQFLKETATLDVQFKEYDYIKILCENGKYSDIESKDVDKSIAFLKYNNEESKFLSLDEQISLMLIVLLGIKNMYLNNTDYYREKYFKTLKEKNKIPEIINEYIKFIKENMNKVEEKTTYSLTYLYTFNLKDYLHRIFAHSEESSDSKIAERINNLYIKVDNEFISFLKYICFDYYVSNNMFENAGEIFKEYLPLFADFKNTLCTSEMMITRMILVIYEKQYNNFEDTYSERISKLSDTIESAQKTNDKTNLYNDFKRINMPLEIKYNIKILLKFYIYCYYYFGHYKNAENLQKVYEFLLFFKDGYDIENFIFKCELTKALENLDNAKIDNINNIEEVDSAIKRLESTIDNLKIVNQFDIDNIEKIYPNIDFNNFKEENRTNVKRNIATGNRIMYSLKFSKNPLSYDFGSAVIEWSKAVETEIDEKLFADEIISHKDKCAIENEFTKSDYNGNMIHFRLKRSKDITIGIFKDMKNYNNGNKNLLKYLYDKYFSVYYNLNEETYNKLCEYLNIISEPRNKSAHKGENINQSQAQKCQYEILASEKILEILSKLKKK